MMSYTKRNLLPALRLSYGIIKNGLHRVCLSVPALIPQSGYLAFDALDQDW